MGAPRPQHLSIRPNHLDKLACEVCHIPALHLAAAEGFDVTTGKIVNYPKIGAKKIGERLHLAAPVRQGRPQGRENLAGQPSSSRYSSPTWIRTGIYYPLFGKEIGKGLAKIKDQLKPKNPDKPEAPHAGANQAHAGGPDRDPEGEPALPAGQAVLPQGRR